MIALFAIGLMAAAAPPMPRWTPAGMDHAGRKIEIDRASLNWRSLQRAWWRVAYPEPRRDGTVEERHLDLVDCRDGIAAVIRIVSLGAGGQVLNEQVDGEDLALQRLSPPTPDTAGETVAREACRLRPPPPPPRKPASPRRK
ncbi:hypothetical protein HJG53_11100 [Sphingomonas sp. ID1715]|uniref:hypothetical protein n=1 Tax=Sphingomonas sp. ID1715 TaxID=1656898 RepID=UPI0014896920|nr:hypothetical protein [Sphingomonas sp. ID1715]NNM77453.1 hypothetical protein [Sphingomonas sp. ID1715]